MYSSERSLDRACHGASAMFSLVVAADFSGTSHSRSSNTLGTLYRRREERRVTSPSRVYFFCNRFSPLLPPSFAPAGPICIISLFFFSVGFILVWKEFLFSLSFSLSLHIAPLSYLPSRQSLRSFPFSTPPPCLSLIVSSHSPLGTAVFKWPRMMNMAVSLVPSVRYGNCCHFYPYLRPRCVWFCAVHARTHARTHDMHVCIRRLAASPHFSSVSFIFARVVRILVPRDSYLWKFCSGHGKIARELCAGLTLSVSFSFRALQCSFRVSGVRRNREKSYLANYLCALASGYRHVQNSIGQKNGAFSETSFKYFSISALSVWFIFSKVKTCNKFNVNVE